MLLALSHVLLATAAAKCMAPADCQAQQDVIVERIRTRIVDRLQSETVNNLGVAPAAVASTESLLNDGLLATDFSVSDNERILAEHFWYQMLLFTEIDWAYFGDETTGRFIGVRRAYACEVAKTCSYTGSDEPAGTLPDVAESTIIRLSSTHSAGVTAGTLSISTTAAATGSDPVELIYSDGSYVTKDRPWYVQGAAATAATTSNWTEPYVFAGGQLGISIVQKVLTPAGALMGVLAADYELDFLTEFLSEIPVSSGSTLFVASHAKRLLASNQAISVVSGGAIVDVTNEAQAGALIANTAAAIFGRYPDLASASGDWLGLSGAVINGTVVVGGTSYQYDAIAIFEMKWVVVVVAPPDSFVAALEPETPTCIDKVQCRNSLIAAAQGYRERTLADFKKTTTEYAQNPTTAIFTLDAAYNNGFLNSEFCTLCGSISWDNAAEKEKLRKQLLSILKAFPEVSWVYTGFEGSNKVMGYLRTTVGISLWKSCEDGDGCASTASDSIGFFHESTGALYREGSGTELTARVWYQLGVSLTSTDLYAWTEPYLFSSGEMGISVVKRIGDGDWSNAGTRGVWAADLTLTFMNSFIDTLEVGANTVVYIMNTAGTLLASNKPVTLSTSATISADPFVQYSSKIIVAQQGFIRNATVYTVLGDISGEFVWIDAIRVSDVEASVSFSWIIVTVTPERDVFSLDFGGILGDEEDDGADVPVAAIMIVILVIVGCCVGFAIYKKLASGRSASKSDPAPVHEMQDPPAPALPGAPLEGSGNEV